METFWSNNNNNKLVPMIVVLLTIAGIFWSTLVAWALGFTVVATSDSYPAAVYRANNVHGAVWGIGALVALAFVIHVCRFREDSDDDDNDDGVGGSHARHHHRTLAYLLLSMAVANWWSAWAVVWELARHSDSSTPPRAFLIPFLTFCLWATAVWLYLGKLQQQQQQQNNTADATSSSSLLLPVDDDSTSRVPI